MGCKRHREMVYVPAYPFYSYSYAFVDQFHLCKMHVSLETSKESDFASSFFFNLAFSTCFIFLATSFHRENARSDVSVYLRPFCFNFKNLEVDFLGHMVVLCLNFGEMLCFFP